VEVFRVDAHGLFCCLLEMFFDDFGSDADDVLAFPIFDEVEGLQRADDILGFDRGHGADVLDREVSAMLAEDLEQYLSPITTKRQKSQIRERFLRAPHLPLLLG